VVQQLLASGRVARAYLGLGMQPVRLSESASRKLGLGSPQGVLFVSVQPDGPADRAGALVGDVLIELGTVRVTQVEDVQAVVGQARIGEPIQAALIRGGEWLELTITVGERPRGCR